MIRTKDLNWVSIDPGEDSLLPPPKHRRWIRVAVLTKPMSNLIRTREREFWAFIDRQTSNFYVEEVVGNGLEFVKDKDEAVELWDHCRRLGLLRIIIPAVNPSLVHFDRRTSLDQAYMTYKENRAEWIREESDRE